MEDMRFTFWVRKNFSRQKYFTFLKKKKRTVALIWFVYNVFSLPDIVAIKKYKEIRRYTTFTYPRITHSDMNPKCLPLKKPSNIQEIHISILINANIFFINRGSNARFQSYVIEIKIYRLRMSNSRIIP